MKKAYYSLSRLYHPDKNTEVDTTEKFIQLKEAYDTLSNERHRNKYDALGQTDFTSEDKLEQHMKVQFRNSPEKVEEQIKVVERTQIVMAASFKVVPYYLTWFILLLISLGDERRVAKIFTFVFLVGFGYSEIRSIVSLATGEFTFIQDFMAFFPT